MICSVTATVISLIFLLLIPLPLVSGLAYCSTFPLPLKPHCQGGLWVLLVVAEHCHRNCPAKSFCVLYCILKQFMAFVYLIVYACLRFQFLDVETNPGAPRPVPTVCRILCSKVLGLAGKLSDPTMALSWYDILLCYMTLVSDMHCMPELLVPRVGRPVLLCQGRMLRAPRDDGIPMRWTWSILPTKVWVGVAKYCFFRFVVWDKTICDQSLPQPWPRWPDIWLFTEEDIKAQDVHVTFLFVGELNGHHEWLGSTTTNWHGVPAFVFTTVPDCDQVVVGQTHECGGTLDLLMFLTQCGLMQHP